MTQEKYLEAIELRTGTTSIANTMIKHIASLEQRIIELEDELQNCIEQQAGEYL